MERIEEIQVRLSDMKHAEKVQELFGRYCHEDWAGSACRLYSSMKAENDWAVIIEWGRVPSPEAMEVQRELLIWNLEILGQVNRTLWQGYGEYPI